MIGRAWLLGLLGLAACVAKPVETASILVSGLQTPSALIFDGKWLMWANVGTGEVMRVGLDGGVPEVLASGQQKTTAMALGPARLYWAGEDRIMRLDLEGGAPVVQVADAGAVSSLVVAGERLIWSADGLRSAPLAGGPSQQLSPYSGALASDGQSVYWNDGSLYRLALEGGAPEVMASATWDSTCIALGATDVYLGSLYGEIYRAPRGGGELQTVVTGQDHIVSLALDADTMYWAAASEHEGTIHRQRAGQEPELLIAGAQLPTSLIVTGSGLLWLDERAGTISFAPR